MENVMKYKGFCARIMEAERLIGESVHSLPPGTALPVYPVDAFLNAPENWIKTGGFVVPVGPNKGLWFDWTMNSRMNTAIIPTVKGCNPITGLQSSGFHLERYEMKCPKHGCDFLSERFCPECNYKWPPQNYVSYPNTLWWDTWSINGVEGRQFFFSGDELRDIATHLIGENTVPAFGFAFFAPKEPRIEQMGALRGEACCGSIGAPLGLSPLYEFNQSQHMYLSSSAGFMSSPPMSLTGTSYPQVSVSYCCSSNILDGVKTISALSGTKMSKRSFSKTLEQPKNAQSLRQQKDYIPISDDGMDESLYLSERSVEPSKPVKEVSIGAGAKICQNLNLDVYPLDSWHDTPDAVMTIYFVFQEKFEELKAGGLRDLEGVKNGMLQGLPVG